MSVHVTSATVALSDGSALDLWPGGSDDWTVRARGESVAGMLTAPGDRIATVFDCGDGLSERWAARAVETPLMCQLGLAGGGSEILAESACLVDLLGLIGQRLDEAGRFACRSPHPSRGAPTVIRCDQCGTYLGSSAFDTDDGRFCGGSCAEAFVLA